MVVRSWTLSVAMTAAGGTALLAFGLGAPASAAPTAHVPAPAVSATQLQGAMVTDDPSDPAMLVPVSADDAPAELPVLVKNGLRVTASPTDSDLFFTQFADHRVVYIESHLPSNTRVPLRAAAAYVDKYTRSRFVFGTCPANQWKAYCIRVYQHTLSNQSWAALTDWPTNRARIVFTPTYYNRSSFTARWRYIGAVHELGHAMGIWWHNPSRKSVMYYLATVASTTFATGDIAILRRH
jgi:hypothetical protein